MPPGRLALVDGIPSDLPDAPAAPRPTFLPPSDRLPAGPLAPRRGLLPAAPLAELVTETSIFLAWLVFFGLSMT